MFADTGGDSGTRSLIMRKVGPMPVWAWGLAGLGAAVAYASWKKNKGATATPTADPTATLIGGDQQPPVVFQDYDTTIINTPVTVPPGGGRVTPPVHVPTPPYNTLPVYPRPTFPGTPAPAPTPAP